MYIYIYTHRTGMSCRHYFGKYPRLAVTIGLSSDIPFLVPGAGMFAYMIRYHIVFDVHTVCR